MVYMGILFDFFCDIFWVWFVVWIYKGVVFRYL